MRAPFELVIMILSVHLARWTYIADQAASWPPKLPQLLLWIIIGYGEPVKSRY